MRIASSRRIPESRSANTNAHCATQASTAILVRRRNYPESLIDQLVDNCGRNSALVAEQARWPKLGKPTARSRTRPPGRSVLGLPGLAKIGEWFVVPESPTRRSRRPRGPRPKCRKPLHVRPQSDSAQQARVDHSLGCFPVGLAGGSRTCSRALQMLAEPSRFALSFLLAQPVSRQAVRQHAVVIGQERVGGIANQTVAKAYPCSPSG